MEDFQSGRRRQAQEDLGLTSQEEQMDIERSIRKEEQRKAEKEMRRMEMEMSSSYRMVQGIAKFMDKYLLDPIIGFFVPGIGDILSSVLVLPFIHVSLFKIKSVPLTLAVIYNVLIDVLIGLIPFYIGDIIDVFNRAYLKNARLITGFVEDDKEVISEVNRKAAWMGFMILVLCVLIYFMVLLVMKLMDWLGGLWDSIVAYFNF